MLISKLSIGIDERDLSIIKECSVICPIPEGINNSKCALPGIQISLHVKKFISKDKNVSLLIYPLAPHFGSEIYNNYFNEEISKEEWPKSNKEKLTNPTYELVIQINGKKKNAIEVDRGTTQEQAEEICKTQFKIDMNNAKKVIFLQDKLINIVI